MDRYQHLPWSVARIACPLFYVGSWNEQEAYQLVVGPEFARAFLHVFWPDSVRSEARTDLDSGYRKSLSSDLGREM